MTKKQFVEERVYFICRLQPIISKIWSRNLREGPGDITRSREHRREFLLLFPRGLLILVLIKIWGQLRNGDNSHSELGHFHDQLINEIPRLTEECFQLWHPFRRWIKLCPKKDKRKFNKRKNTDTLECSLVMKDAHSFLFLHVSTKLSLPVVPVFLSNI